MGTLTGLTLLRPWWLLLLVLIPLWWLLTARRDTHSSGGWKGIIPDPVLARLQPNSDSAQAPRWSVTALLVVMALALSGPSVRYSEQPLYSDQDSLVVVLDVSLSMLVEDIPPDRLTQAKRKIRDLLVQRDGAETALVAYAGDAHTVSPLTRDGRVIESFLPALDPFMMPAYGGRADLGVARAVELLDQAGRGPGRILLITDGIRSHWHDPLLETITASEHALDILAVGTSEGGPIPLADRGYLREGGEPVIVRSPLDPLETLASSAGGQALRITTGDTDLETLAVASDHAAASDRTELTTQDGTDDGIWIALLAIPLVLLARRHGHLGAVAMTAILIGWHPQAQASVWSALWFNADQHGAQLLEEDPAAAADRFSDTDWRATAHYRAGQYQQAAELWGMLDTARARYNKGNALAFAGKLREAVAAYDQALELDPEHTRARENRQHLLELLQEQQTSEEAEGEASRDPDGESRDHAPQHGGMETDSIPDQRPEEATGDSAAPGDDRPADGQTQPSTGWDEADRHEQWLQRIPDNPASLLQRKFQHEHSQRERDTDPTETDELW